MLLDEFEKGEADIVVTVTDANRSPYFNMVKIDENNNVGLVIPPEDKISRRQDAPTVYDMTTVAYVAKPDFIINRNSMFEGQVRQVHIPIERALDIDTPLDFKVAECIINAGKGI